MAKRPALKAVESAPDAPAAAAAAAQPAAAAAPAEVPRRRRPPAPEAVPAAVQPARRSAPPRAMLRLRHHAALVSFVLLVLVPFAAATAYLYLKAADEYHSDVSFSIRSEEPGAAAAGLLGAITGFGGAGGSAAEPDILFEYIRSQEIVEAIDKEIDLRTIFNRRPDDWVFSLGDGTSVEDLLAHWRRMVSVSYENQYGIIQVKAKAFTPEDAQRISAAVLEKSTQLVNRLAEQARSDAIRYAEVDLGEAEAHLRDLRGQMAAFRRDHQIIDPQADVEGQADLLSALQGELAKSLVDRDMLLTYASPDDQRVQQANRRIAAVSERVDKERNSLGGPTNAGKLPEVVGDYESLQTDMEFASQAYTQAMASLAVARAEARRQARYLAAHIEPTLAESALYPRRATLAGMIGLFLLLGWGVLMLVYYNVRDNR